MDDHPLQLAESDDYQRISPLLARAFFDDPVFAWLFPDHTTRLARMKRLFALLLRLHGPTARIVRGRNFDAASIWQPPGTAVLPFSTIARNAPQLLGIFGRHVLRSLALSKAIESHFPGGRFWYVHFVGVEPEMQGSGWGHAMMRQGLMIAGQDGLPTYLETARASNASFYESMGFRVIEEWDVENGPHFWSLLYQQ